MIRRVGALEREKRGAERREAFALAAVGRALVASGPIDEKFGANSAVMQIEHASRRLEGWRRRLSDSLDQDRADYAIASPLGRWLVVARGVLDRFVVRDRIRFTERELEKHESALGRIAIGWREPAIDARLPAAHVADALRERATIESSEKERAEWVAPYGGDPWPAGLRELRRFAHFVWKELRPKLLPRAPAIAGILVGWWIGSTFSDSWRDGVLSHFGGSDRHYLSSDTLRNLQFWLPLTAAALCAYLGEFIGARVHRRYMPGEAQSKESR